MSDIYRRSQSPVYQPTKYNLDILRPKTADRKWYQLDPLQQRRKLSQLERRLAATPITPEAAREEARKPLRNALQIIGSALNVPSAMISGAAQQLVDGIPGFDAQEYFKSVFNFKGDQVSWSDVIEILADRNQTQNMWDKRWVQVVAGLSLDIILDPLNFFGAGALTKISGEAAEAVTKTILKMLKNADPQVANKIYFNILNRGFKRVWGFQLPWRPTKTIKGIQGKVGKELSEYLMEVGKLPREALESGKIPGLYRAMQLGKESSPIQKLTMFLGKTKAGKAFQSAFMPNRATKQGVLFRKLSRQYDARHAALRIQHQIDKMQKANKLDHRTMRQLADIVFTFPYVDDEVVRHNFEISGLMNTFIGKYAKGGDWRKTVEKLGKKNELFTQYFDLRLKKQIEFLEKSGKKLSPAEIVDRMGDMYDQIAIKQLRTTLDSIGFRTTADLETLARFSPKADYDTIFKTMMGDLTLKQKQAAVHHLIFSRSMLDEWYEAERLAGIPVTYKRDYITKMTGAVKRLIRRPTIGGRAAFTYRQWSKLSPVQRFDAWVDNLVKTGAAKNAEHAGKLLREGKIEKLGKMVDTVDEALWIRGQAHVKAMHKTC
jgi:hypothetical protein